MSDTLEQLLIEVEQTAALIKQQTEVILALDCGVTAWTLDACRRVRHALATGDALGAAYASVQLGERLAEFRKIGDIARRDAAYKPRVQRDHERDVERRAVHEKWCKRGFKTSEAYEKAAKELGVSAKAIQRAKRGY